MIQPTYRVRHPAWPSLYDDRPEKPHEGNVVSVNAWHADVLFDGWPRTVRAAIASLEPQDFDFHAREFKARKAAA